MSEQDVNETVDAPEGADEAERPTGEADTRAAEQEGWDGKPFDPERARRTIEKLREEKRAASERAKEASERAKNLDISSTEATKRVAALESELLRTRVIYRLGLPESWANRLQGDTEDELMSDAEQLLGEIAPKKSAARPVEKLRPGGAPVQDEDEDPKDLLARVRARNS